MTDSAASDTCQLPAASAVEIEDGTRLYRCDAHRGISGIAYGPIWETVQVKE